MTYKGIFPATITPMNKDFSIDFESFKNYLSWLKNQDVSGFAINVDTGEGPSLTSEERIKLLTIAKEVSEDLKIIAGIIGNSTESAVKEAKNAVSCGSDAFLIFPHETFRGEPQDTTLIYKYHEAIATETDKDLIIFNLQDALGGCLYTNETLKKLISIPQVKAIKEASFDLSIFKYVYQFLKNQDKKISFLTGNDNFILDSFSMGVDGGLLGSCAQLTQFQVDCLNFIKNKQYDKAKELSNIFQPIIDVIFMPPVSNYRARTKYSLKMQGVIPNDYVRPPLTEIPNEEKDIIKNTLKSSGIIKN
ncbi:MAG: dihydrodipicolinate synthase family protein [Promethearchaeota archaeon]|nr:MAG: dihydrodipicolinate synthase family protein [Candidatus Lokiarchaeota archaeon]